MPRPSPGSALIVLNFALGWRAQATTDVFIERLRAATAPQRCRAITDRFQPYVSTMTTTLSDRRGFAQLIKVYALAPLEEQRRGKPLGGVLPLVCVLQFLPDSSDLAGCACDGSGNYESALGSSGTLGLACRQRESEWHVFRR